jgi:uncharacterized OB-fold protein
VPYVLAIIELDEGVRMTANLVGIEPDNVSIGMPVTVTFEELAAGFVLPQFRLLT